ncbi:fructose-bisphosphate aldolase [Seinonella peptonophila]|uniref:Fructose-bisphosphate aldolase n=1 Tax=Seinonella peptonophila TaxID=112248 RepID=A0A1M5A8W8_9BACL|nr:class II fructose-bisphosphate aldolase [Seinonella peptonophila]SHF26312.1 fructose-bisphosphate aldolase [Seinonella peptonophila]
MGLVTMKEILDQAELEGYGVGAFSVANMEMVMGAIAAAEELRSPLILQIAEVRLTHSPLHLMGPLMVHAAQNATVPVAVHFDHGLTQEKIKQALDLGFTSVMFDGSHYKLAENIEKTCEIVTLARTYGATVEAEIGQVGGSEDGSVDIEMQVTNTSEAKQFAAQTQIDALAIAIGNAHGNYQTEPQLRFDRLIEIDQQVKQPLVLHGGSGIKSADFRKCIRHGIRKINVATASFRQIIQRINQNVKRTPYQDYFSYTDDVVQSMKENVMYHMKIFGSEHIS